MENAGKRPAASGPDGREVQRGSAHAHARAQRAEARGAGAHRTHSAAPVRLHVPARKAPLSSSSS
eukprot:6552066-Lingulodinium_polyedra.AAC.1